MRTWGTAVLLVLAACGREPGLTGSTTCGEGTVFQNGQCIGSLSCGAGTHLEGNRCFADTAGLACGAGTTEQAGVCVGTLQCGAGTVQQGTACIPVSAVTCGAGTELQGTECVAAVSCGPGTALDGGVCVPACGPGTVLDGGGCVSVSCGPGTALDGGVCVAVPGGWYEVRIGATSIPADGVTKIPVLALGRLPDGTPATDAVTLAVNPTTAGSVQTPSLVLGQLGVTTWFTPCNSATSSACVGTARVQMRLASAPTAVVAESQEFSLVAPAGVGSTAPCDPYANALFFDGSGYIFTGTQTVTVGSFSSSSQGTPPTMVHIAVTPSMSSQGAWWDVYLAAPSGSGPLIAQVYPTAERWPFQPPGVAGLSVTGDGRGCNTSSGRFQVHRLVADGGQVDELEATFEQFCEKQRANVLRGCVKYTR